MNGCCRTSCSSTLAVVKRETNSWRYPLIMAGYLFALAYVANVTSPPPPSVKALVIATIIGAAVTMVLTRWVDRHRESTCLTR